MKRKSSKPTKNAQPKSSAEPNRTIPDCAEYQRLLDELAKEKKKNERQKKANDKLKKKNKLLESAFKQNNIPVPKSEEEMKEIIMYKRRRKIEFRDLIPSDDIMDVLNRLHRLIDGKIGKEVARVLLKAKAMGLISALPSEAIFNTEFNDIKRTWRSISKYLDPKMDPRVTDFEAVKI